MQSTKLRIVGLIALLVAGQAGHAQPSDEAWIVERIVAGRFDELRGVEAESESGSPAAMYWWGAFLQGCVFGRCDEKVGRDLWLKAAELGHPRARMAALASAASLEEAEALGKKASSPETWEDRLGYAMALVRLDPPGRPSVNGWGRAQAILRETAASDPRLAVLFAVAAMEGPARHGEELRAMVAAGHAAAAEQFRRALLISQNARYPKLLALAKAGDTPVAVALCQTVDLSEGYQQLPADLLPVCERAFEDGYPGIAPVLLRHYREVRNAKAAAFYAEVCASLGIACASELAEYHFQASGKSPSWTLWDAVAGLSAGFPPAEARLPTPVMQQVFAIRVGATLADRACLSRRYDTKAKAFEDDPACPQRRRIRIPAEIRGGQQ